MHFLQTFLQTLLALAATVHGAPKIHKDPKDATTLITPPKYKCGHTTKLVMSRYMFEGTAWSVHEMEILNAIKKAQPTCTVTNWRYREETGLDGLTNFQAVVSRASDLTAWQFTDQSCVCSLRSHAAARRKCRR
jgi:hypothetical protein